MQKFISGGDVFSRPFPSFPFPYLSSPLAAKWPSGPSNPAKGFGETNICRHQTRSLGSKYTENAFAADKMSSYFC